MTHWSNQFVGLPYADLGRTFDGVDCWGLARFVLASRGIEVPSYAEGYASAAERAEISGLIKGAKPQWLKALIAQPFDLLTFRRGTLESHVAVVVEPGRMLHVTSQRPSCIESYVNDYWHRRLTGHWRHVSLGEGERP